MKPYSRLNRTQVHELIQFLTRNVDDNNTLLYSHGELARQATIELGFSVNRSHIASFVKDLKLKSKNPRPIGTVKSKEQLIDEVMGRLALLERRIGDLAKEVKGGAS